jgi:hypothetical protein
VVDHRWRGAIWSNRLNVSFCLNFKKSNEGLGASQPLASSNAVSSADEEYETIRLMHLRRETNTVTDAMRIFIAEKSLKASEVET